MKIAIIGAGVIGVSVGLQLAVRGHDVTIFDREGVASATSQGNAGAFAFTDVAPLATPGVMSKAPRWLLDPLGPLSIPPAYALNIAPWLLRFWRASWADRYEAALEAQVSLMTQSRNALERLAKDHGMEAFLRREGQLQLYEGAAQFEASQAEWRERERHGVRFRLLRSPGEIAEIQPGIAPRFTHAGFTPDWSNVTDPKCWVEELATRFRAAGGRIEIATVQAVRPAEGGVWIEGGRIDGIYERAVIAGGAWSKALTRELGDAVPLETERGYNTTLPAGAFDLKTHVTFSNHAFVVSRIGERVRVGGAVELGGLKLAPNMKRAEFLLSKAKAFLPGLKTEGGVQWMGFRPSMPDSLPVISPSSATPAIVYAFGHGHLGLTQSAGTAELVADLVDGRTPAIDVKPFRAQRF
ncbi:NAD(P)/FAD-dependent oxidoreductase [Rhizobium sp. C4]|uniref:NAD(P)/FAD-dependent oxidoreductase n=1 Tax=Rhizobium sp. C4 TaxID=1349800 RepID=UPI001E3358D1|nr:FAD-dependent oxidoreductase [Rhizobium sp. C4]MCD2172612.1 FAD-dependent oxidoreductase [Rhizobium sp. C4]